ncbi:hypothetical protein LCGC14_1774820 [marine sediment metagenome]|uniref:DUF932 domain-containing protein n=1 Tax=marine sediment metagenome TaxID=412755 RepID=A0A0F9JC43_9ZZZZ
MKSGMTIEDLLTEVQRQSNAKKDYVASTQHDVRMVPMAGFPSDVAVVLQKGESSDIAYMDGDDDRALPLERLEITEHAHRQIAGRLQIPWKFYARMLEDHQDIVIDAVNKLFEREPGTRLLRTMDNKLRAFLSNRYKRIDNDQVLGAALPEIVKGDLETTLLSSQVTDRNLYLKVLLTGEGMEQQIGETRDGTPDIVKPGFSLRNSEIGAGSAEISAFFYRDFCYNGCVFGKADAFSYRRVHLGGTLIEGTDFEVMSDKSKKLEDEVILSQVTDVMHAIATPEFVNMMGNKLRSLKEGTKIENPVPAIEVLAKENGLTQTESDQVLQNLIEDRDYSRWGMVNAVTKVANSDAVDYDRASDLEVLGSKLIDINAANWKRISEAVPVAIAA